MPAAFVPMMVVDASGRSHNVFVQQDIPAGQLETGSVWQKATQNPLAATNFNGQPLMLNGNVPVIVLPQQPQLQAQATVLQPQAQAPMLQPQAQAPVPAIVDPLVAWSQAQQVKTGHPQSRPRRTPPPTPVQTMRKAEKEVAESVKRDSKRDNKETSGTRRASGSSSGGSQPGSQRGSTASITSPTSLTTDFAAPSKSSGSPRSREAEKDPSTLSNTNVYVSNLPANMTDAEFKATFACYGTIIGARFVKRHRRTTTFGFVQFTSQGVQLICSFSLLTV